MANNAAIEFVSDLIGFLFSGNKSTALAEMPESQIEQSRPAISKHRAQYLERLEAATQARAASGINSRESEGLKQLVDFQLHSQCKAFENAKQRSSLSNSLQKRSEQDDISNREHSAPYDHIGILFGN